MLWDTLTELWYKVRIFEFDLLHIFLFFFISCIQQLISEKDLLKSGRYWKVDTTLVY